MASKVALGAVLVTGGCGYLGAEMVKTLSNQLDVSSIHVISRNPTKNLNPKAQYHACDITNYEQVTLVFEKVQPKVIIHCAAGQIEEPDKNHWNTNFTGTKILLQCAAESQSVKVFVATSTEAVMYPPTEPENEEEARQYENGDKVNAYCITKSLAEKAVLAANDSTKLLTVALRMPILYGGDDDLQIGAVLKGIVKGQHKIQIGPDELRFEFLFIEKACEAHILAARKLLAELDSGEFTSPKKVNGEAFLISDGASIPLFKFNRKTCAFVGHPVSENEIKIMPFALVNAIVIASEWAYWIFTLGKAAPPLSAIRLSWVNRGSQWKIDKAKERLGYVPANQDEVLERTAVYNMKRLGL